MRALGRASLDLLDLEHGQFLAMAALAPVILALFLLEHDDLGAARLLYDSRTHGRFGNGRHTDHGRFVAADREHVRQFDLGADVAHYTLDGYLVAHADAVLFSACPYDCKHAFIRTLLATGREPPCQIWPGSKHGPVSTRRSPVEGCALVRNAVMKARLRQSSPRRSRPSGEIICGVHGGSHTRSTLASATPGSESSFWRASIAIDAPIPQPCAVSVILTSTRLAPPSIGATSSRRP